MLHNKLIPVKWKFLGPWPCYLMIYASFDLCQFSLVSEENLKDLTSSSQLKKSMVKEWGRGTPLFSQADSILRSALNVFISSLPQISYQRDRNIQMCWSSNVTGRNTKQMGYFCKRKLIPDEKIRLQGTLCFTLSPTLTLIDALSDNRIVESQVFLPLSLLFIKVLVIRLIILFYTGFSSRSFSEYIFWSSMISLFCGFIFISFSQYWACTLNLKARVFLQLCQFPHFFFSNSIFLLFSFSYFGHVLESLSLPTLFLNCSFVYSLYVHLCVHVYTHTWASHSLVYSITIQSLSHVWLFATPWTAAR